MKGHLASSDVKDGDGEVEVVEYASEDVPCRVCRDLGCVVLVRLGVNRQPPLHSERERDSIRLERYQDE